MKIKNHLSETAFLINDARAQIPTISKDIYAHLWVNSHTKRLHNDFVGKVYPFLDLESCLRNRFFLDNIKKFIQKHPNAIFVNLASGFTNYPFLIKPVKYIEIDLKHVIDFKKLKVKKWQKERKLPNRNIDFYNMDFNNQKDLKKLAILLKKVIKNKPSFILLEGITYYLRMNTIKHILDICRSSQSKKSVLSLNCFAPNFRKSAVFSNFEKYVREKLNYKADYNLFSAKFIKSIAGYRLQKLTDIPKLEKKYKKKSTLNFKKIFPEYYVVLEKK